MRRKSRPPHHHGYGEVAASRYFALYLAMLGWLALGAFLGSRALWPSTCQPESLWAVYACSGRLGEARGWAETALMTWLWSTPLLIGLEIMRHVERFRRR